MHAPPFEFDPVTFAPPAELVQVGPEGTVRPGRGWTEPLAGQPLEQPFAWALIRLDGADTALLHAVDAGSAAAMRTGMRVRARWADRQRATSAISPVSSQRTGPRAPPEASRRPAAVEPVSMITTPIG